MSDIVVHAFAAEEPAAPLKPFTYTMGPIEPHRVDVEVESCGICASDLSMLNNDWGMTTYPFVPGHEVVGRVVRKGEQVPGLEIGDRVGVGWYSASCQRCDQCLKGHHNLCPDGEQLIVGRHGGFADIVRCHWLWATPIPEGIDPVSAGPLFCGGITVFHPILQAGVRPIDRVGVIGIGGLGHLAIQFLYHWGCEVTAFTSTPDKAEAARDMGAHRVVNSGDPDALKEEAGRYAFILNTTSAALDWEAYLAMLEPEGVLHTVGAVLTPMPIPAFLLIAGGKSVSGSPLGSPSGIRSMMRFAGRHGIRPVVETFPMQGVNDAMEHLRSGGARFRVVLTR